MEETTPKPRVKAFSAFAPSASPEVAPAPPDSVPQHTPIQESDELRAASDLSHLAGRGRVESVDTRTFQLPAQTRESTHANDAVKPRGIPLKPQISPDEMPTVRLEEDHPLHAHLAKKFKMADAQGNVTSTPPRRASVGVDLEPTPPRQEAAQTEHPVFAPPFNNPMDERPELGAPKTILTEKPSVEDLGDQRYVAPGRTRAELDPTYFSLELPSLFTFYSFDQLSVRKITGYHQAKFARAAKEESLRYLIEAISATMGDGINAGWLTPQDFFFVLYWQRLNSFTKNPQLIKSTCNDPEHIRRTLLEEDDPEYLDPETLLLENYVHKTDLETDYLETVDLSQWRSLHEKYNLGYETMQDMVDAADIVERISADPRNKNDMASAEIAKDEIQWMIGRASFLRRMPGRASLESRIDVVRNMSADDLQDLEDYIEAVTNYGVVEFTNITCQGCKARHRVRISVDALDFLPNDRRS